VIDGRFLAFMAVMAVFIVTPGPDTAITIRNALRGGRRAAALTAVGVGAGSSVWALAAAGGVAGLLAVSAVAFTVFKLAGGAYLLGLGLITLLHARRPTASPPPTHGGSPFAQGLINNLLNPKAAALFLTVVPQFVQPGDSWPRLVAMVLVFDVMVVGWLCLYGLAIVAARAHLGDRLRRGMEAITGTVLVGLGVRLALERR
jgi:threonine/homoserine/homoserine lactone efflux protein